MNIEGMTDAELNEAMKAELNGVEYRKTPATGKNVDESPLATESEDDGYEEEASEERTSEDEQAEAETDQDSDQEEAEREAEGTPKHKPKGAAKLLAQRNAERQARIAAEEENALLKARLAETMDPDLIAEYVATQARATALAQMKEEAFYANDRYASEAREHVEQYKNETGLDTETAFKLYLAENDPEELAVRSRKAVAKTSFAPRGTPSPKLRAEPKPEEMTSDQLAQALKNMYGKGEIKF